ncbi:MAG: penicillin-binding protein activator LpoB [Calditrichaeota bacterium]|nr:penicillin-binding protein activator LpoB [Calditrichota bacterium]
MKVFFTKNLFPVIGIVLSLCFLLGCAGTSGYVAPGDTTQMDDKFGDTDLKMMANSMYNSLMSRLSVISQGDEQKIIALLSVKNKTSEHIDTDNITDKLQIALLKAGTMRFVDRSRIKEMTEQFDLGGSGMLDPNNIKKAGKVLGADYFIYGDISSITKSSRKKRLTYYRLSLKLLDSETNELIWADEFEIKKEMNRSFWER